MESHPLNLAHQQHRRAEAHFVNQRYDEAMQCHHNAAELLLDALKSTTSSVALESLTLQHSYHLKQKDLIKMKKEQYERVKQAMDDLKGLARDTSGSLLINDNVKIQVAVFRTLNETDNWLAVLKKNNDQNLFKDLELKEEAVDGKSPNTVLDKLQILNSNIKSLVDQLVLQIELLKDENITLKERITYLEKERTKYLSIPTSQNDMLTNISQVNLVSEKIENDVGQKMPIAKEPTRPVHAVDKTGQPHFDLSALKDL